jgi:hypothetical protein
MNESNAILRANITLIIPSSADIPWKYIFYYIEEKSVVKLRRKQEKLPVWVPSPYTLYWNQLWGAKHEVAKDGWFIGG